jgi:hypothetical protein
MPEPIVMELGTYITQPVSTVHFTNPSISNTSITAFQIAEENLNIA